MSQFEMLDAANMLAEDIHDDIIRLLKKVQYIFAKNLGISVSLHALLNFFMPGNKTVPAADDDNLRRGLQQHGYRLSGGYEQNKEFWNNILTSDEYKIVSGLKTHQSQEDEEETFDQVASRQPVKVSKRDYSLWLRETKKSCKLLGLNPTIKRNFEDCAFDVLDNDPMMDMIGNNEETKRRIVNYLWHQFKFELATKQFNTPTKRKNIEDEEYNGLGTYGKKGMTGGTSSLNIGIGEYGTIISDGYRAGEAEIEKGKKTPNPYTSGTLRHKLWEEGYLKAIDDVFTPRSFEDEEQQDNKSKLQRILNDIKEDGRRSAENAIIRAIETGVDVVRKQNPHRSGSQAAMYWQQGWEQAMDEFENA